MGIPVSKAIVRRGCPGRGDVADHTSTFRSYHYFTCGRSETWGGGVSQFNNTSYKSGTVMLLRYTDAYDAMFALPTLKIADVLCQVLNVYRLIVCTAFSSYVVLHL